MFFYFKLCLLFFIVFSFVSNVLADNIRHPVKSQKPVSENEYQQLEMLIKQIHSEREIYYKLKNEWAKEKNRLTNETGMLKKEIQIVNSSTKEEESKISKNEKRLNDLENNFKENQFISELYIPVLTDTIKQLENNIRSGLPFRLNERLDRLNSVKNFISDSGKTIGERFRRVWDLSLSEIEYSMTNEEYSDIIEINNERKVVNILRIGNFGMYYKTNDSNEYGILISENGNYYWNNNLSNNEIEGIEAAFSIVSRSRIASIINLPIIK